MAIIYGETVKTDEYDLFVVEAIWPDKKDVDRSFGRYTNGAFNDIRDPNKSFNGFGECQGNFDEKNPDVAKHPSRIIERRSYGLGGDFANIAAFTDVMAAIAYAERLNQYGELSSVYGGRENWRKDYKGEIKTRVVHERMALITKVVSRIEVEQAA